MSRNMSADEGRNKEKSKETYIAQKFLGKGAFGVAYLIKSEETGIYYVNKKISLESLEEEDRKKVMNEAILLKMIDHPNIIKFKEVFKVVKPFKELNLIMEYANSGDINKKIKEQMPKHFEEKLLIDWLTQLCNALQYIHHKKIIHRDIKPANIFLNDLGQIKLGDFGISKNLESLKMATTIIGSMDYLAPEIVEGKNYSFEADIWSLGVTFYELMTFKKPFKGNFPGIYLKILKDEVESITDFYSKEFRNLIYNMLNKDPSKRLKAKEILKLGFIKNRMLSYLQEKRFNFKDSFALIKNYQKLKYKKNINNNYLNYNKIRNNGNNNFNVKININFNDLDTYNKNNNKLKFISKNSGNNIKTINHNTQIRYKFNLQSDKELNNKLLNQRYNMLDENENNKEKASSKDKYNNFRKSAQISCKMNKITLSNTKIRNEVKYPKQEDKQLKIKDLNISQQNSKNIKFAVFKNDKNNEYIKNKINSCKEESIKLSHNEIKNLNDKDKEKYDFHRQMNIFSSYIDGKKTDEQIEEENNIFLKNYY